MTWMLTHTGSVVDLRFIERNSISALDIAHSLSLLNRFTGHTTRPYSVAEHCLLVVEILEREAAVHDRQTLLAALLHDAHEAYTIDLSSPMTELLGSMWDEAEWQAMEAVLARFGALAAWHEHRRLIKHADMVALATERRDLMAPTGPEWPSLRGIQPVTWINLNDRAGMAWQDWRQAWLDRFALLHTVEID